MAKIRIAAIIIAGLCVMSMSAAAQGIVHARGARRNAMGGITARSGTAFRGPNGGVGVRGRSVVTDGQGNATTPSGAAYRGPNGSTAERQSSATRSSDGSASRQSSASASGPQGSAQTSANYQRNADGSATATRNTTATGANGNTYQGDTTWTKGSGVQHTGTCKDPSGNVISCPGK
jgi:hypothetical protein